jgi:holliday junction DNA helicase RuvA
MIGRIRGLLVIKKPTDILVEANGVGYEIQIPLSTLYRLPDIGDTVTLLTYLQIREDAHLLYGFFTESERMLFKALIKVSGVGPKMGLAILSGMEVRQFVNCIEKRSVESLVRLPGVGQKTAERLMVEMAGKLEGLQGDPILVNASLTIPTSEEQMLRAIESEAIGALTALGYKPAEANRAIVAVRYEGADSQGLIRRALQALSKL